MTKQFVVEDVGQVKHADSTTDYYSTEDYTSFFESSDLDTDTTCKSSSSACTLKNKRKPKRVNETQLLLISEKYDLAICVDSSNLLTSLISL